MVAAGLTVSGSPLPFCLASWVKTVVVNLGRYAGYEVWNCQRQMTVISGLPSLVSANNRTESRASAAVTRSGCWRSTAREKPASSSSRVDPAGTGAGSPGDSGLFSRPSTPPRTSVRAGRRGTPRAFGGGDLGGDAVGGGRRTPVLRAWPVAGQPEMPGEAEGPGHVAESRQPEAG